MLCYSDDLTLIKSTNHVSRGETLYRSRRSLLVLLYTRVETLGKSFSFCKYSVLCEAKNKTLYFRSTPARMVYCLVKMYSDGPL